MRIRPGALAALLLSAPLTLCAGSRAKPHTVGIGVGKHVPYSIAADPANAMPGEKTLHVRPLVVDDKVKEWTTGEVHDITDRTFVVRRALRINDALPGDKGEHWIWQRGPWIMIDRVNGHVTAMKLPDYDPTVSQVVWFRDYAAYCGLTASGKSLYAVVAQLSVRKPVLAKKLNTFDSSDRSQPACSTPEWQREPLRATFHPAGKDAVSFDIVPGSAVLVEESDEEPESAQPAKTN